MKVIMMLKNITATFLLIFVLVSCGGSGDDVADSSVTPPQEAILKGVAAAGAPIVGIVRVKDALGNTRSADIAIDGSFELTTDDMTPPFVLSARGTAGGQSVELYSTAMDSGSINITPVTDYIAKVALGKLPSEAYNNWESDSQSITQTKIDTAENTVQEQLQPLLTAAGVDPGVDLMSTPFEADHTGVDAVLDVIDITYAADGENTATITGPTGTTITEGSGETFTEADGEVLRGQLSDGDAIQGVWTYLQNLYATQKPTDAQINNFFLTYVAEDYLERGINRDEEWGRWLSEGPEVGMTLEASIIKAMTPTEYASSYTKGYWIEVTGTIGTQTFKMETAMVQTGSGNWLWYGNREYMDINYEFYAEKQDRNGTITYSAGVKFDISDRSDYGWDQMGVRSAIVTGPGLPSSGQKMARIYYPEEHFQIWNDTENRWDWHNPMSDASLDSIPMNPVYTLTLCKDSSTDILNGCDSGNIVQTKSLTIAHKPLTNIEAQVDANYPTITSPTPANISEFPWGDSLTVSWVNSANGLVHGVEIRVDDMTSDSSQNYYKGINPGETSVTFDTSNSSITSLSGAHIYLKYRDVYNRKFRYFKQYWQ